VGKTVLTRCAYPGAHRPHPWAEKRAAGEAAMLRIGNAADAHSYWSYKRHPNRECTAAKRGKQRGRIVSWRMEQTCQ